ncbi:MAG: hypothetical protein HC804_03645 [Anaerolineae bacterium]|nr:hypothetical protein [Anaerolineae bacterium]
MVAEMSYQTCSTVIDSWERVRNLENYQATVGAVLFAKLFELEPDARRIFGFRASQSMEEMKQSLRIIEQALDKLPAGPVNIDDRKIVPPPRAELGRSMEAVIHHFKLWTEGFSAPAGYVYQSVESPRGEFACYLRGDGGPKPARCHFRTPSYVHLASLPHMSKGRFVADVVSIIGSVDIVLGEIDR